MSFYSQEVLEGIEEVYPSQVLNSPNQIKTLAEREKRLIEENTGSTYEKDMAALYEKYELPYKDSNCYEKDIAIAVEKDRKRWMRKRNAKFKAERIGLKYWPALIDDLGINPETFKLVEDILKWEKSYEDGVSSIWDMNGHYGISPYHVRRCWFSSGCRANKKFKELILTLHFLKKNCNDKNIPEIWIRKAGKKGFTCEKVKFMSRAFLWLERNKVGYYGLESFSSRALIALGKMSGFGRAAAVHKILKDEPSLIRVKDLNWQKVKETQGLPRWRKAEMFLSPHNAWGVVHKTRISNRDVSVPYPSKVRMKVLKQLLNKKNSVTKGGDVFFNGDRYDIGQFVPSVNLAGLFDSIASIERYKNKFMQNADVHSLGQFILPSGNWNKTFWMNMVLKFGPEVLSFSSIWESIEKSTIKVTSLKTLRAAAAQFMYKGVNLENIKLAKLCLEYKLSQNHFDQYKKLMSKTKKWESIPHVLVKGEEIKIGRGWVFEKLEYDDPQGPLLGLATNCCQHLHSAGRSCAEHGVKSPYGGFYVVRYNGKIVAQSWAWRGSKKELVFDNIEFLSSDYAENCLLLYEEAAKRLTGKLSVTKVLVGLGYGSKYKNRWRKSSKAIPADEISYSDAKKQAIIAKYKN
jgi:hypothetical protein